MRAGVLRNRIAVQTASHARDATGGITPTWSTAATRWGAIIPLSGRELEDARQVEGRTSTRIVMRYYSGLTSEYRLTHGGRTFEILSVLNLNEADRTSSCLCEEVTT